MMKKILFVYPNVNNKSLHQFHEFSLPVADDIGDDLEDGDWTKVAMAHKELKLIVHGKLVRRGKILVCYPEMIGPYEPKPVREVEEDRFDGGIDYIDEGEGWEG